MPREEPITTPVRRSTRHQPQVGFARARNVTDWSHQWSGVHWHTRTTRSEDLHQDEHLPIDSDDSDEDKEEVIMETMFYEAFSRTRTAIPSKGKGKQTEHEPEPELFKVGDTILIHSDKKGAPNVGVIVALWDTRRIQGEPADGVEFESMKVRVHWFVRPEQTAKVSARREHLKNEIYFSLKENATLAPADVIGRCDVSSHRPKTLHRQTVGAKTPTKSKNFKYEDDSDSQSDEPAPDTFFCSLALDAPRGLYYDFKWEQHRKTAMRGGPHQREMLWNVQVDEKQNGKRTGPSSDADESSDEGSDVYTENEDEEDQELDDQGDDAVTEDEAPSGMDDLDDEGGQSSPPRKRKRPPGHTAQSNSETPRKRRKPAAPTPHSKAALRSRMKRKMKLSGRHAVTVGPPRATTDYAQMANLPRDPWLRAMHVLHVGARPDALPCRDNEYMEVMSAILSLVEEGSGGCVYISGVPGTGKTATVHAVVRELKAMAERSETNPFTYVEINGLKVPEPSAAYALLWEAVSGHDASEGHLEVSAKEALKNLNHHFTAGVRAGPGSHACVVLMDELDQLVTPKQDVIYNFFNWPSLASSKLIVIAVANTHDLPERVMSGKVRSRLGMVRINFHPYDRPQLQKIVHARLDSAKEGLSEETAVDVFEADAVKFVAMKVAGVSGDARRILDVCRRAVELIRSKEIKKVEINHVRQVLDAMQNSPTAAFLQDCSLHERIMLASLLKCVKREGVDEIRWGDVQRQHRIYMNSLTGEEDPKRKPSDVELALVMDSLVASRAMIIEEGIVASRKHEGDRKVVLNIESGEVERVLSEVGGTIWKNALGL